MFESLRHRVSAWVYRKALNYVCDHDINYRELREWLDKDSGIFPSGTFQRYIGKMGLDFKWVDKRTPDEREEELKALKGLVDRLGLKDNRMTFAVPVTFGGSKIKDGHE